MKYCGKRSNKNVQTLIIEVTQSNAIDLDPPYQRGIVWSEKKQGKFIESCYIGFLPHPLMFNYNEDGTLVCMDGKQRITSLINFRNNKIFFEHEGKKYFYDNVPEEYKEDNTFSVLSNIERVDDFNNVEIGVVYYTRLPYIAQIDLFNRIQNGIALTAAEKLAASIDREDINKVMKQLCDSKKKELEKFTGSKSPSHRLLLIKLMYIINKNILCDVNTDTRKAYLNSFETVANFQDDFKKMVPILDIVFHIKVLNHFSINEKCINKNLLFVIFYFVFSRINLKHSVDKYILRKAIIKTYENNTIGASATKKALTKLIGVLENNYTTCKTKYSKTSSKTVKKNTKKKSKVE